MIREWLAKLRSDKSGVAAVEFALWTTFLFSVVMAALDFGGFYIQRGQIDEAVSAGALQSFDKRDNANFSGMEDYVRSLAEDQSLAVTVSCNGSANSCTNLNRTCACLRSNGTFAAQSCGSTCTGSNVTTGSTSGYYLTVEAEKSYKPMLLPKGLLNGAKISQSVTVRLQ